MEDVRQLSSRIAMLERQAEVLRQNMEMLQAHLRELMLSKETVESIKEAKEEQEILIPLGGGANTYGKLIDNKNILINIGSNIAVKKDVEGAIKLIEKRIDESKDLMNKTSVSYSEVSKTMAELEQKGRQMMQQQSAKKQ